MPKLLQINVTSNWGSTGKIAEAIGVVAQQNGWESYIAYGRYDNPSKSKTIKIGKTIDVYFHYLLNRLFDLEGRGSYFATLRLIRQIKFIKPDVIHLHNIHDHYLNYPLLFKYLNRTEIKIIWTFHDCWAFTGHCCHFVEYGCNKWKIMCCECPMRNKFIDRSEENFLLKKDLFTSNENLIIVPVSEWLAAFVRDSFFRKNKIEVIHNGVDLNVFHQFEHKQSNGIYRVLAVSNVWLPYKGLNDIIKLRTLLSSEYEITIVGLGENQISTLPNGIVGIKRTQNVQELVKLYGTSDVFINTSYADTFPTVNLEALACGTPVITYKTGGSPEAVDERTGIIVPQGDVEAMAKAIVFLTKNPLSSIDCRNRAEALFDKDKCYRKYIDLYNKLIMSK